MKAALERQRWFGVLAVLLVVPLPVTGVATWPFLIPYLAVALRLAMAGRPVRKVPTWVENVLAPAIVVAVVVAGGARFGILRPVAHLALLLAAVRLPVAARRGSAPLSSLMLVLVGVAGIASSTHPILVVYILFLLVLVVTAVGRWSSLSAAEAGASAAPAGWPGVRVVGATVVLAVLVAAPLFALFPRLRSPFASTPFGGRPVSGFRESVSLSNIGDISQSRRLALRVRFPGVEEPDPEWLRLVGATLNHYRRGIWLANVRTDEDGGESHEADREQQQQGFLVAEFSLEVPGERLFVPVGSGRLSEWPDGTRVRPGPLSEWRISRAASLPVRYQAEFAPGTVAQPPPIEADLTVPAGLDDVEELARTLAGEAAGELDLAERVERHLQESYGYTTALTMDSPLGGDPVNWFLFEGRRGHCEFFASAMVLLLRTQGIPARLQVGYLGGEHDGRDGFLVRDSNAHAWVAAFVDGEWRIFDPTPAVEQPGITAAEGLRSLWTGWLRVEQFWDRWILTFSMGDQVGLVRWLLEEGLMVARQVGRWVAGLVLVVAAVWVLRRVSRRERRRRGRSMEPVSRELEGVLDAARRRGVLPERTLTPRQAAEHLVGRAPDVEGPLLWLVNAHEHRRYALGEAPPARRVRAVAQEIRGRLRAGAAESGRPAGLTGAG